MLDELRQSLNASLPAGWTVEAVSPAGARLRLVLTGPEDVRVTFSARPAVERAGPFDVGGASVAYERTDTAFDVLSPAGRGLAAGLLQAAPGGDVSALIQSLLPSQADEAAARQGRSRDIISRIDGTGAVDTDLQGVRQLALVVPGDAISEQIVAQLATALAQAQAAEVGEVVIHAPAQLGPHAETLAGPGASLRCTLVLRFRTGSAADAHRSVREAAAALVGGRHRVVLVHVLDRAGAALSPEVVAECGRLGVADRLQLMVAALPFDGRGTNFAREAPQLEAVRPALETAAIHAAELGLGLVVAPGPGLPSCMLPEALRPGPDHARRALSLPGHSEAAYAEPCITCALRSTCPGVQQAWLEQFGSEALKPIAGAGPAAGGDPTEGWQDRARALLLDRLGESIALTDVLPPSALPAIPCVLPWTAFEHSPGGASGPCCANYQSRPQLARRGADHRTLWNGADMQAFRRAVSTEAQPSTCSPSCPILRGGGQRLDQLRLHGGPDSSVAAQLRTVEDMLQGREVARGGPLELRFATTTFCNYDCLMCSYGELGSLDDEADDTFYAAVGELLPELLVLEALGGEPLASPRFRRFLEETPFDAYPQLRVALITNASYLTPKQLDKLRHVPLSDLTISVNAASPETYLLVNRGLEWARIRRHLDALLDRRRDGELRTAIKYSMVILRSNLTEIAAFAELAWGDGVDVRFRLPNDNRNGESIMTDRALMTAALESLEEIARQAWERGAGTATRELLGVTRVLSQRLEDDVIAVLR